MDEPQTNSQDEEGIENADESDESTGQVELKTFKTKITCVNPGCYINSDRQGYSRSQSKNLNSMVLLICLTCLTKYLGLI